MFEKFGELNSFGEINELAENLFNEGDTESLKAMAKENGIQNEFVQMYLQGDIPVLHRTFYLESLPNGSIWLALCLYTPFVGNFGAAAGQIVDNRTGLAVLPETYELTDCKLLSRREADVLALLAKGKSSKQIAEELCISIYTVYRHRQNILAALQVSNTAAAVEIGMRLHLIPPV